MINTSIEKISHPISESSRLFPKLLSSTEVFQRAKKDFNKEPQILDKVLEEFVNDHVRIVQVGNTEITIVDQEHDEYKSELSPVLQAYLNSPRTQTAVVEYFMPELLKNAANVPAIGNKAYQEMKKLNQEGQGSMFMEIAEIMKKNGKTVTCVDIANKLSYELYYALMKGQFLPFISSLIPQIPYSLADRVLLSSVLPMVSWAADSVLESYGKGIYDKQRVSWWENLIMSMEDGRRIYAAKGLENIAKDFNGQYPTQNRLENNQIVVIYPKAHSNRIVDYMTSSSILKKGIRKAKQFLYYLPNLDYSYRIYSWKEMLANVTGKEELASWQLTASKKFGPLQ